MVEKTDKPLVHPGIFAVHTKDHFAENGTIDLPTAAKDTLKVNQPDELRLRFLYIRTLIRRVFSLGDTVVTHVPAGSYSQGALQVIGIRGAIALDKPLKRKNGRVPTRAIQNFRPMVQKEYYRQILGCIRSISERYDKFAKKPFQVLFTENAALTVSDENHRVARTIAEPHAQIWIANATNAEPFDAAKVPMLLRQERRLVRFLTDAIDAGLTELSNDLISRGSAIPEFKIRSAPPYGYVMETRINRNQPVSVQAKLLSSLMRVHHERYTIVATRLTEDLKKRSNGRLKNILLPQPSYKVFGTYSADGYLEISIAPTIIAGTGVIEVLDRQIYRSPDNVPSFQSAEDEEQYYRDVADDLEKMSSD